MSMVAMAVHELRTPLTLLRGYIEALGDDLTGKLPSVDAEYLHKMDAAGQQLVTFINNVLNVARITDDQFLVRLHEEAWPAVLETAVADMKLRAMVHGITLETTAGKDLPTVGVDRSGMYEVICNLIDNAIKYSGNGKKIVVRSTLTEDGLVQTDVQDFGIGIPSSVVANLFDKYYRSHRSRDSISGTGLGLYLCKTIVNAHGGNIWVRSAEGKGSIFSFTVLPFSRVATELKGHPEDLTRTAHGWIKNHSLYRR
jgi:signal transduction histidine kinase